MQKLIIIPTCILLIIAYSSCVTSLFTVATYENIITEKRIEGVWGARNMQFTIGRIPIYIQKQNMSSKNNPEYFRDSIYYAHSYMVDCRKDSVSYQFNLDMTRIGKNLFVDLAPAGFEAPIDSTMWQKRYGGKLEYLPTFTIAKLYIQNDSTIILRFINGAYLDSLITEGKIKIRHEVDKMYGMFLITASSKELQQFLLKYGDYEHIYSVENTVILKRITSKYEIR